MLEGRSHPRPPLLVEAEGNVAHAAIAAEHDEGRQRRHAHRFADALVRVRAHRVTDATSERGLGDGLGLLVLHPHDEEPAGGEASRPVREGRLGGAARGAPGGPEGEHDDAPPQLVEARGQHSGRGAQGQRWQALALPLGAENALGRGQRGEGHLGAHQGGLALHLHAHAGTGGLRAKGTGDLLPALDASALDGDDHIPRAQPCSAGGCSAEHALDASAGRSIPEREPCPRRRGPHHGLVRPHGESQANEQHAQGSHQGGTHGAKPTRCGRSTRPEATKLRRRAPKERAVLLPPSECAKPKDEPLQAKREERGKQEEAFVVAGRPWRPAGEFAGRARSPSSLADKQSQEPRRRSADRGAALQR